MGGWAGTVRDVDATGAMAVYEVAWTVQTLQAAPGVYLRRCRRDELDAEATWLDEDVLEPDSGGPLQLEQPSRLKPRPLDFDDPDDRARCVFGLSSDDELPPVGPESLRQFHQYLSKKVRFPFPALLGAGGRPEDVRPALVLGLLPWEEQVAFEGLQVEVQHESEKTVMPLAEVDPLPAPNGRGLEDVEAYRSWYIESVAQEEGGDLTPAQAVQKVGTAALLLTLAGALLGGVFMTCNEAVLAAKIGGGVLAVLGGLLGGILESFNRRLNRQAPGFAAGSFIGVLVGGAAGAALGPALLTYLGAIPGAIAGTLLASLLGALGVRRARAWLATLVGAYAGALAYLFVVDSNSALVGTSRGVLYTAGGIVAVVVCALTLSYLVHLAQRDRG
jgi:hypothetical protein